MWLKIKLWILIRCQLIWIQGSHNILKLVVKYYSLFLILYPHKQNIENSINIWGTCSDFIWPFLRPYMGVIPNPKMAFIFPISCILALIFPILIKYFPKCVRKGSFPKSQIKSLTWQILHIKRPSAGGKQECCGSTHWSSKRSYIMLEKLCAQFLLGWIW